MAEVDLDAVDAGWSDDDEESGDDPDAVDAGWGDDPVAPPAGTPRRHRSAAEKTAARKAKAASRKERQRARAEAVAAKQKPKQQKRKASAKPNSEEAQAAVELRAESIANRSWRWTLAVALFGALLVVVGLVLALR